MAVSTRNIVLCVLILQYCSCAAAQGISVVNPSFEENPHSYNYLYISAGPTGWSVQPGGWDGPVGGRGTVVAKNGNGPWGGLSSGIGGYYCVLQRRGWYIEQTLSGVTVGETYRVRFLASSRRSNSEVLKVTVDSESIFSMTLPRGFVLYEAYFTAQSTSALLRFENDCADDNDRSVFLDDISVELGSPPPPPPPPPFCLSNPSFELDDQVTLYTYMDPTGWEADGNTVVAKNGNGPWGGLSTGVGQYYAVLQRTGTYIKQSLCDLVPGQWYRVQFLASARSGGFEAIIVKVAEETIFSSVLRRGFSLYEGYFRAEGATAELLFQNNDATTADRSVFVDAISVEQEDPPPPIPPPAGPESASRIILNPSFELDPHTLNYFYQTPTDWNVLPDGHEGSRGNKGTVVAKNGNGPWGGLDSGAGDYYAVIQRKGNFLEQTIGGLLSGRSYSLSFLVASRPGGLGSGARIMVLVDDQIVLPSYTPAARFGLETVTFTAANTTAVIRFENDSPDGQDRSVFIDAVSITRPAVCTGDHDFELMGNCFKVFLGPQSHAEARASCQAWGGELVSIPDEMTNAAIRRRAMARGWAGLQGMWTGLTRSGPDWVWSDGTSTTEWEYTNWAGGVTQQPDNAGGAEDCVAMQHDGRWADVDCGPGLTQDAAACLKPAVPCDVVASEYCYIVRRGAETRADASSICSAWGGTLATIPDETASASLVYFVQEQDAAFWSGKRAWVGLAREQEGGVWTWDDEQTGTAIMWASSPTDQTCAQLGTSSGDALYGASCSVASPYMCSRRLMMPCAGTEQRVASSGVFGDGHSHPNQRCEWVIRPGGQTRFITFSFLRFDIEKDYDFVEVLGEAGERVALLTGAQDPADLIVEGSEARVTFASDWRVQNAAGFEISYIATSWQNCSDAPCDNRSTCATELDGSFTCACHPGYQGDGDLSAGGPGCGDVNECDSGSLPYPCGPSPGAKCTNLIGAYTCSCEAGFSGNPYASEPGVACENVDECVDSPCHADAVCRDLVGSFNCTCKDGFAGDGFACVDVDECVDDPCDANAACVNFAGGFNCSCNTGYMGSGFECGDIDECKTGADTCDDAHGLCTNNDGSFSCSCNPGWTSADNGDPSNPDGDGTTCYDADECSFGTDSCGDAECTNADGSYSCACPSGFTGEGGSCYRFCTEDEANECHILAFCYDGKCVCDEGIYGHGYGDQGCRRDSWAVRFNIRLPWLSPDDVVRRKLRVWEQHQPAYIALLTLAPPPGFNTSMHHEVELAEDGVGGLLTINALFETQPEAEAARVRLQGFLDADTPPTVFNVQLSASQTTLRRELGSDMLIQGAYPVEPRIYTWVAPTTSAETRILPTGLTVDALYFTANCKQSGCWVAEITYTLGSDNFNVMYIPRAEGDDTASFDFDYGITMNDDYAITAEETFVISNFPCGTDDYVPETGPNATIPHKVTACCIPQFLALYRPVLSFTQEVGSVVDKHACDQGNMVYFLPGAQIDTDESVAYSAKPQDAIRGTFAGMEHAEVVPTGVLDPYIRQYTALVFFDEVELRRKAGILRGTVGVEHTVDTFIGIANFKPTGQAFLDPFAMQVNLHMEKTDFFSVSTHGENQYTFLDYVNMRLVSVLQEDTTNVEVNPDSTDRFTRTNSSGAAHYVQVTFTLGESPRYQPIETGIIPSDSVLVSKGVFMSTPGTVATRFHACDMYDDDSFPLKTVFDSRFPDTDSNTQLCAPSASMCASPSAVPDGFVSYNIPLGIEWLPQVSNQLDSNVFVSLVVSVIDTVARGNGGSPNDGGEAWQLKTTLTASIPVVDGGVNIFCDGITAKTDLKDVANADIVFGSAQSTSEMSRLRILEDIASSDLSPTTPPTFESDSIEAGLMTLVVKGNSSYFGRRGGSGLFGLQVEDFVSVHVMEGPSGTKMTAVKALLSLAGDDNYDTSTQALQTEGYRLNGAFRFTIDRSVGRARLEPTEELLSECPFSPPRPSAEDPFPTTCVTRRDISARDFPSRLGADPTATEVQPLRDSPFGPQVSATDAARNANGEFMQSVLGASDYAYELGKTYGHVLGQHYNLNGLYRRAFWINPGYEWTPTQTAGQSRFQVSQKLLLFALINLDEGFSSRRRVLLSDVSGSGAGLTAAEVSHDVSPTTLLSKAFGVPQDRVATYSVVVSLSAWEACQSEQDLRSSLREELEQLLRAAASPLSAVQVVSLAVDAGDVQCQRRTALGRALLSSATASVETLVVFEAEGSPALDTALLQQSSPRILHVVPLEVDAAVGVSLNTSTVTPDASPENDESGGLSTAVIGAICGGVGGALLICAGVLIWMRAASMRQARTEVAAAVEVQKLDKGQLLEEATGQDDQKVAASALPRGSTTSQDLLLATQASQVRKSLVSVGGSVQSDPIRQEPDLPDAAPLVGNTFDRQADGRPSQNSVAADEDRTRRHSNMSAVSASVTYGQAENVAAAADSERRLSQTSAASGAAPPRRSINLAQAAAATERDRRLSNTSAVSASVTYGPDRRGSQEEQPAMAAGGYRAMAAARRASQEATASADAAVQPPPRRASVQQFDQLSQASARLEGAPPLVLDWNQDRRGSQESIAESVASAFTSLFGVRRESQEGLFA